jgi:penicillin amidase
MRGALGRADLTAAVPALAGAVRLPALSARAEVWRDPQGIPHVRAASFHDAFLAQGFVHAQDRLWHMEYDRRRAYGRWAEYAGPGALAQDTLLRRFRLGASARADYAAVNAEARAMLDAYAAGVNGFLRTTATLPIEFGLLGARPEPWAPWDCLAVFKVRHVLMGVWQLKAWRGRLVRHLGAARAARLCPGTQPNPMLIVPPGVEYRGPAADGLAELTQGESVLAHLADWDGGSNNWAVAGRLTASGKPLVAGDPHRALDVPNVYYQNHVACPEFDAIGLSFPGVPGFPHFGHNAAVAWCVTHTGADYQDLYVERFDREDPRRYAFGDGWRQAETERETIRIRGADPVEVQITVTHHGPVVLGDPASGYAIAVRYTATAGPNRTVEAFLPMLRATSGVELEAAMRPWVDPVNNLVFADVHGAIGYRTRGEVPIRAMANAWLPVPGWDGHHEWQGSIPFDEMPALRNPETGFVATANSRVAGPEYQHYIGLDFASDFRTRRLVERLRGLSRATVADMAAIHADRVSIPARAFVEILRKVPPADAASGDALERLLAWDGTMEGESVAATIYAVFRERLVRDLLTPVLGALAAEAFAGEPRGAVAHMGRLRAQLTEWIERDDRSLLPPGADWPTVLARALTGAVRELRERLGPDVEAWRWGRLHATRPEHPLAGAAPELAGWLNPPAVPMGGDGDTVQAASFIAAAGYEVSATAVARYVFDLGDWDRSAWVIPLGASGHPGSPHFADQAAVWGEVTLVPMRYDWKRIGAEAETHQVLDPA